MVKLVTYTKCIANRRDERSATAQNGSDRTRVFHARRYVCIIIIFRAPIHLAPKGTARSNVIFEASAELFNNETFVPFKVFVNVPIPR